MKLFGKAKAIVYRSKDADDYEKAKALRLKYGQVRAAVTAYKNDLLQQG